MGMEHGHSVNRVEVVDGGAVIVEVPAEDKFQGRQLTRVIVPDQVEG